MPDQKTKSRMVQKEVPYSGFAIAGFILSFFGILSILGIIFSLIALNQIKNRERRGRGLAIAGFIIGIVVFLLFIFMFSFSLYAYRSQIGLRHYMGCYWC